MSLSLRHIISRLILHHFITTHSLPIPSSLCTPLSSTTVTWHSSTTVKVSLISFCCVAIICGNKPWFIALSPSPHNTCTHKWAVAYITAVSFSVHWWTLDGLSIFLLESPVNNSSSHINVQLNIKNQINRYTYCFILVMNRQQCTSTSPELWGKHQFQLNA